MPTTVDHERFFRREVWPTIQSLRHVALTYTQDADELLQQASVRAWKFIASGRLAPDTKLRAWCRVIVQRVGISMYHAKKRELAARAASHGTAEWVPDDRVAAGYGSQHVRPEDQLDQERARQATRLEIEAAIRKLPRQHALTLRLHDLEGHSYQEIANRLDIAIGTVMSRIHRAREQLHVMLYDHARAEGYVSEDAPPPGIRVTRFTRTNKLAAAVEPEPPETQLELSFAEASGMW